MRTLRPVNIIKNMRVMNPHIAESFLDLAVSGILNEIAAALARGEAVTLPGLGRFVPKPSAARKGFNPRTRTPVVVPAKTRVRFTVDPALAAALPAPVAIQAAQLDAALPKPNPEELPPTY